MGTKFLGVAIPWALSHYIPLNGFHPLYRGLFDHKPEGIDLCAWDNACLDTHFRENEKSRSVVWEQSYRENLNIKKLLKGSIARQHREYLGGPNLILTRELPGDIEFHHTAPFPSLDRPFVFHCESFAPVFLPFSGQGSGNFSDNKKLREYYRGIFSNPLCLGIYSHIPETLESFRIFFGDEEIDRKLIDSRVGLSSEFLARVEITEKTCLSRPRFLFVNSAHQNPENVFNRGGHLVLRFWKEFRGSGRDGMLVLRCKKPDEKQLVEYGVDTSFLNAEEGDSIFWAEDYLAHEEINRLMESSDFLLLPSLSLHSVSIMQAMATGTVPVVTDTVGTSIYVADGEHGIVLQGVREANWRVDPDTGLLFDTYSRNPALEKSLVSQMTSRIIGILSDPGQYDRLRNNGVARAQREFSGEAFSVDFWGSVACIYDEYKKGKNYHGNSKFSRDKSLEGSLVDESAWARLFESMPQPQRRMYTGDSVVWSFGGAFVHAYGNPAMSLKDWSVFEHYFDKNSPLLRFSDSLGGLEGRFLSFGEREKELSWYNKFVGLLARKLTGYPKIYAFGRYIFKRIRPSVIFINQFLNFLRFKYGKGEKYPDIELIATDINGFSIARFYHKYCAIPEGEGDFDIEKIKSGFSSLSCDRLLRKVKKRVVQEG